jgi:lysophospholipase L1-like esterase
VLASIALTLMAIEGALRLQAGLYDRQAVGPGAPDSSGRALADARQWLLTMPEAWKRRETSVPGAAFAYYWQGALHVWNEEGFRLAKPLPPKRDDTYRVMVVGDSFVFGLGIAEDSRFSNLVEQRLSAAFRIDVINMGHNGYRSEDVLAVIRKFLPILRPNLVLYGVCLCAFLSGEPPQYPTHPFPLPGAFKNWMIAHTHIGALSNDLYDATLRRFHLRRDFYDDILADFAGYQRRFASDVAQMNEVVQAAGLPPLLAMVIDQFPVYQGRGYRIARIAEEDFIKAGAEIIPSEPFYRAHSGRNLSVSRWEGHPNEEANRIWAEMIAQALRGRPDFAPFAHTLAAGAAPRQ